MKYIYIKSDEDRVVYVSTKQSEDHAKNLDEYIVADDFDMTKEFLDNDGKPVRLANFLTATEFLERYNADYVQKRISAYPSIEDQLDKIYHEGLDAWKAEITAIKTRYPKV